ncbi:hypothetical protein K2173_014076 [Erythroxylum novogranatense]|uniref:SHSP domain-containing protein n=1 Tax=Erythroxylum novogranatense TaxID=1862640 RepID=A0AAV8SD54_9ROSI|nr:hypothetical protein K2173_014076 [Erythroxylum novogranatense]
MASSAKVAADEHVYESFEPTVDWTREPEADTLIVYLPGFKREQLKVQLTTARTLRLSGERPLDGKKLSTFRKELPISFDYDSNGITAKFENGILYVRHPKPKVAESAQPPKPPQDKDQSPSVVPKPPQAKVAESTQPPKPSQEKERPPTGAPKPPQSKVAESTQPPKPSQDMEQPPSIQAATAASKPDQKPSEEAGKKGSGTTQDRKSDSSNDLAEINKNNKSSETPSSGADEPARENRKDNHSDLLVGKPRKYFSLLLVILLLVGFAVYAWKSLTAPELIKQSEN